MRLKGSDGGVDIQLVREAGQSGDLTMYVFLVMDAQVIFKDGHFHSLDF